jgi:hypothetical protein
MPPEARMSAISFDGKVSLTFTNEMIFPDNFASVLNDRNKTTAILTVVSKEKARELGDKPKKQDYLQLVMLRSEFGVNQKGNLISWTVSTADSREIKIDLEFDQAQYVSQRDTPD